MKKSKKVILAFSGGLDTSFCVLWLQQQEFEVITVTVDTGGFTTYDKKTIAKQSKLLGVTKHYFIDGKAELYEKIASFIIKGNILRGGVYPLSAGPERLIIAQKVAEIAFKEKANAIAHGSTGAGNDQVRFDIAFSVLVPKLKKIAPIRQLGITREQEVKFLNQYGITVQNTAKDYSINKGMLGITIGGKETKTSWESLPEDVYPDIVPLAKTPDKPEELVISFINGLPIKINGKKMTGIKIFEILSKKGREHGVGKGIHLGTTILGIKGRVGFAAPAVTILIKAHKELEKLVLTKWQLFWKDMLCEVYGNFLHEGLYFDPVMRDIEVFIHNSQSVVSGEVKVKLFKGNIVIEGVKSPYSLLSQNIAVYGEEHILWTVEEVAGFSKLYGLQSVIANAVKKREI